MEERAKNNFQELMEVEFETRFTLPEMNEIEHRLRRRQDSNRLTSDTVDLFFPKFIRTIMQIVGGDNSENAVVASRKDPARNSQGTGQSKRDEPKAPGAA